MARMARLKVYGESAYYLITSHTVWERQKAFTGEEKDRFVALLKKLSRLFFVQVLAYVVMDNHFHIVVKVLPSTYFSDEEIVRRVKNFYKHPPSWDLHYWRRRLEDLSEFVKLLKQLFAQWYNRRHSRSGHLWSERFHSVLLERGRAVLAAMMYVDLNPLRAGMVKKVSGYLWTSYSARIAGARWLAKVGECGEIGDLKDYMACIEGQAQMEGHPVAVRADYLMVKIRHMTRGIVLGGKEFVEEVLLRLTKRKFIGRKESFLLSELQLFSVKLR